MASGLVLTVSAAADPPAPLDPAAQTILNIRIAAAVLDTFREQGGTFQNRSERLENLGSLSSELGPDLRRELVSRDGWGRALKVFLPDSATYTLISFAADGRRDEERTDPSSPDRDIIFSSGRFIQRPRGVESAGERAMADIRAIATALESFAVDSDVYPGPTEGLKTIDTLADDLEPIYVRALPRYDPWGHPYFVWSDDKTYLLVSAGADGSLEDEYASAAEAVEAFGGARSTEDDEEDIVFINGAFLRWPADPHEATQDAPDE
jgi:hypothetical protein